MTTNRDEILDLIVRWEEAKAQGRGPAPEDLCKDRPELREEFLRHVAKLELVDWLNAPIEGLSTTASRADPGQAPDLDLPRMMAGRYRLDAWIGEGGFGRVYRGFDTWLERPVAVKVPRVDRPLTSPQVDLCRLGGRKVARPRHPDLVGGHRRGAGGGARPPPPPGGGGAA